MNSDNPGGKIRLQKHPPDADKALEILLYLIQCGVTNIYNALKVIYYADKDHLSRYGRSMYDDRYQALQYGAVPATAYTIIVNARGEAGPVTTCLASESFSVTGWYMEALRASDIDVISESEFRCLDRAIEQYGKLTMDELKKIAHEEPEYKCTKLNTIIDPMAIIRSLPNAEALLEHLAGD